MQLCADMRVCCGSQAILPLAHPALSFHRCLVSGCPKPRTQTGRGLTICFKWSIPLGPGSVPISPPPTTPSE